MINQPASQTPRQPSLFRNRIDRVQTLCSAPEDGKPPDVPGFRVVSDYFVRGQTSVPTYSRVRRYANPLSGTQVFVQYRPVVPWLEPIKATFRPQDEKGLLRQELEGFLECFPSYRLLTVEVCFDFNSESGVDAPFVRRHALFGKSWPRDQQRFSDVPFLRHQKVHEIRSLLLEGRPLGLQG